MGLYEVFSDRIELKWEDSFYNENYYSNINGFYLDGKLYGAPVCMEMGAETLFGWNVYDFASGELLSAESWNIETDPYYLRLTYNPNDGCVYGEGQWVPYDGGASYLLMKAPLSDPKSATVIRPITEDEMLGGMCFNVSDNKIYGVDMMSRFVSISTDGITEPLFDVDLTSIGFVPYYLFGMTYSPVEDAYYLVPNSDTETYLVSIDAATQTVDVESRLNPSEQMFYMFSTDEDKADGRRPMKAELISVDFVDGSLSGYLKYKMPEKTEDGTALEGTLKASLTVDGEEYGSYSAAPGAELSIELKNIEQGMRRFSLTVEGAGHSAKPTVTKMYIGYDEPAKPANVKLENTRVSWDAVEAGVHEGYVDLSKLTYRVTVNGEDYGTTGRDYIDIVLPESEPFALYTAEVKADNNGMLSEAGVSNSILAGSPWNLPVRIAPTADEAALCTVVDANRDGSTWRYNADKEAFYMFYAGRNRVCDDWLITMPLNLTETTSYLSLIFDAAIANAKYGQEKLSVWLGTEPTAESMTTCLIAEFTPMNGESSEYQHIDHLFKVMAPGKYYIGFHGTSEPLQRGIYLKSIAIESNHITDASPAKAVNLQGEPSAPGHLFANVSFDMPTTTIAGDPIEESTTLMATVSTGAGSVKVEGKPGGRVTAEVPTQQGDNTVSVRISLGSLNGQEALAQVYTGVSAPATPVNVRATAAPDMSSMTVTWDPVTTASEDGQFVDPEAIRYNTYLMVPDVFGAAWQPLGKDLRECEFTYTVEPGSVMTYATIGVEAVNVAGSNGTLNVAAAVVGTPYTVPFADSFINGRSLLSPWLTFKPDESYSAEWLVDKIADYIDVEVSPEGAYGMIGVGNAKSRGRLGIPRFTTKGLDGVALTLTSFRGPQAAETKILGTYYGAQEPVVVGEVQPSDEPGFGDVTFELPAELMGKDWVQLYIDNYYVSSRNVFVMTALNATETSGIRGVATTSGMRAVAAPGAIRVFSCLGTPAYVYTVDGRQIAHFSGKNDTETLSVIPGIYIVRVGTKSFKLAVR